MLKTIKKNKVFSILLIISLVVFLLSFFLTSLIDNNIKKELSKKILNIYQIQDNQVKFLTNKSLLSKLLQNSGLIIINWLLGISLIGIPIILFLYFLKLLLFSWNCYFLLANINIKVIPFVTLYIFSTFFNIVLLFLVSYYAITYSIILFKTIILKKNYLLNNITKNYSKILIIIVLISLICTTIEYYILPKIILFF